MGFLAGLPDTGLDVLDLQQTEEIKLSTCMVAVNLVETVIFSFKNVNGDISGFKYDIKDVE